MPSYFETLVEEFIEQESIHKFQKINKVIKIFANKILAFEIEEYTIKLGDILIIKTAEGNFYKKPILTIGLNNELYTELIITQKTKIAVEVETRLKDNQTFYIVKQQF